MSLPLTGVKILDLTRLLPGPFATLILADLGADVLKVEDPKLGDYIRMYAPFINKQSAYFLSINRNKKSMHCNLKAPEGKEVFIELVKKSDVLIESFRPGVMARLGLGFDVFGFRLHGRFCPFRLRWGRSPGLVLGFNVFGFRLRGRLRPYRLRLLALLFGFGSDPAELVPAAIVDVHHLDRDPISALDDVRDTSHVLVGQGRDVDQAGDLGR